MLNIPEEIKELVKKNSIKKNLRIHFPNGERDDITNKNLVSESFSFEESICSEDVLKFGLCEASVVEFQTVGIENIKKCEIEVFHEIDISSLSEQFITEYGIFTDDVQFPYYRIPYGRFTVNSCPRQADMSKRKVTAYTKELTFEKISVSEMGKRKEIAYSHANRKYYDYDLFKFMVSNYFNGNEKTLNKIKLDTEEIILSTLNYELNEEYSWRVDFRTKRYQINSEEKLKNLYYFTNDFNQAGMIKILKEKLEKKVDEWSQLYHVGYYDKQNMINATIKQAYPLFTDYSPLNGIKITDGKKIIYMYPYGYDINFDSAHDEGIYIPYSCDIVLLNNTVNEVEKINVELDIIPEIYLIDTSGWMKFEITETGDFVDNHIDFREATEAYVELMGMFGHSGRNGEFEFILLNNTFGLFPSETLYPSNDLYPTVTKNLFTKTMYKSAWYDDEYTHLYYKVICNYKDADTQKETYLEHVIFEIDENEEEQYQVYDISNNYLIKENTFTREQIMEILLVLASNIENVQYMPADVDLRGLPYVEAGDVVQVLTNDGGFETIVLRRTLTGIQALSDNFESRG